MQTETTDSLAHGHDFGLGVVKPAERGTRFVVLLTAGFMVAEVAAGLAFGSMALLADGLHMASHAFALGLSLAAYVYARRRARDPRFSFGVGKVSSLAGFTGALLLAFFALAMALESVRRLVDPVAIRFDAAILVAALGLGVNLLCGFVLLRAHHGHDHDAAHEDHNLRAATLHVLADALTSLLAIGALLTGKFLGWNWMDAAMGLVGAAVVSSWALGLLRQSSRVLLDWQAPPEVLARVREALEARPGDRLEDLHVWSIGPGLRAACLVVTSADPLSAGAYRRCLPPDLGIVHANIEVHARG